MERSDNETEAGCTCHRFLAYPPDPGVIPLRGHFIMPVIRYRASMSLFLSCKAYRKISIPNTLCQPRSVDVQRKLGSCERVETNKAKWENAFSKFPNINTQVSVWSDLLSRKYNFSACTGKKNKGELVKIGLNAIVNEKGFGNDGSIFMESRSPDWWRRTLLPMILTMKTRMIK